MTNREFMEMVIANVENEEMVEFAKHEIEKLNARNERRKNSISKKALENEPIKEKIIAFLEGKDLTLCKAIAESVEISTQKCTALCRQLVDNGILTVADVKVKSKGTLKAYKLAQ